MHRYNIYSLSFALPLLIGTSGWIAPVHANPAGIDYRIPFPQSDQVIDRYPVPYGNPIRQSVPTDSGYYYSSPYLYNRPRNDHRLHSDVPNFVLVSPTIISSPIRNSTLINPTIVNRSYYPSVPYYPAVPYYPSYYPNLHIFSVKSYTRPSPEIVVDPQYGVRFKNPPGY